jgi:hypothetical protein
MDRGADNIEAYCHCREQRSEWVVRATQKVRKVLVPGGKTTPLNQYLQALPLAGTYQLRMRARGRSREHGPEPARTAQVEVRFGPLQMPFPVHKSPYLKKQSPEPLTTRERLLPPLFFGRS